MKAGDRRGVLTGIGPDPGPGRCGWFLGLLLVWGLAAAAAPAGTQVRPAPSVLAQLVGGLQTADATAQREFAVIAIEALLEAYRAAIQTAAQAAPKGAEPRQKLARWQRATAALVAALHRLREALDAGAQVGLDVDRQDQVLILVDAQVVLLSGPHVAADAAIERQVLERFCAFNDCAWLVGHTAGTATAAAEPVAGVWELRQSGRPSYGLDGRLQFEFDDLSDRDRKAAACYQAADELERLWTALQRAIDQGHSIDWRRLGQAPLAEGPDQTVVLNADGAYLRLPLPLLARVTAADWERILRWLREGGFAAAQVLRIEQADRLVQRPSR